MTTLQSPNRCQPALQARRVQKAGPEAAPRPKIRTGTSKAKAKPHAHPDSATTESAPPRSVALERAQATKWHTSSGKQTTAMRQHRVNTLGVVWHGPGRNYANTWPRSCDGAAIAWQSTEPDMATHGNTVIAQTPRGRNMSMAWQWTALATTRPHARY